MGQIRTTFAQDPTTGKTYETTYVDFTADIAAGMEFLDRLDPGWVKKIDTKLLDLESGHACVCGQVFQGHFDEGVELMLADLNARGETWSEDDVRMVAACDYGFQVPQEEYSFFEGDSPEDRREKHDEKVKELIGWARVYAAQREEYTTPEDVNPVAAARVLYSILAEQWIAEINKRLHPLAAGR